MRVEAMPICEGKAAIVPPPEPPWLVEPEEQPINMTPAAEVTVLEMRHMTEPEHQVAVAELQRVAGTQLDPRCVDAFVAWLAETGQLDRGQDEAAA